MQQDELIPHLFRTEYSKIVAVLYHSFSLTELEIAEDIASDTFLKATETWGLRGVPENPTAWLYSVAKNKVRDYFKRNTVFESQVKEAVKSADIEPEPLFEFTEQNIADSQLAMIFLVCNSNNSTETQVCLALQILCGFSVQEIANAFLTNVETIKKRLYRGRVALRTDNFRIKNLNPEKITTGLDGVLKTLYLLFNEGYFSKTSNQLVRKDLCSEATRLTLILTENKITNTTEVNALLALMCFQSSRLDARTDENGEAILFDDQDKSLWNQESIERGNNCLVTACTGNEVSKYHLEAIIAYWHTTPTGKDKWTHILQLYNQLLLIEYSPVTALNRTFAFAKVHGSEAAILEAEKLRLDDNNLYHSLLGYLYTDIDADEAKEHYLRAIDLTKSKSEKNVLTDFLKKLKIKPGF